MALTPVAHPRSLFTPVTPIESVLARTGDGDLSESSFRGVPPEIILYSLFAKCHNPLTLACVSSSFYRIAHTPIESRELILQVFSKNLQTYLRSCLKPHPTISQIFQAASAKLCEELQLFILNPIGVDHGQELEPASTLFTLDIHDLSSYRKIDKLIKDMHLCRLCIPDYDLLVIATAGLPGTYAEGEQNTDRNNEPETEMDKKLNAVVESVLEVVWDAEPDIVTRISLVAHFLRLEGCISVYQEQDSLNLPHKSFTRFSEEICSLPQLKALYLPQNNFYSLSGPIGNLTELKTLNLNRNQFSQFPCDLQKVTSLTELWFFDNRLSSIPECISELSLRTLDLRCNAFTTFPEPLCNVASLLQLNLSGNTLTAVPPDISKLSNLRDLCLAKCALSSLPDGIGNLPHLGILDIGGNNLESLPATMGQLSALRTLYIWNNRLPNPLPAVLGKLPALEKLYVDETQEPPGLPANCAVKLEDEEDWYG